MVKHVILWQLKDELSAEEKAAVKAGIKEGLESLIGVRTAAPPEARRRVLKAQCPPTGSAGCTPP